jgi:hypothetical protein
MLDNSIIQAQERAKDMLREAIAEQRTRELLDERRPTIRFYAPLLDWLGHILISAGLHLRSRYSRLELGEVEM